MDSAMTQIRRAFPRLRRTAPTAIVRSGGTATVFGCLCGDTHTVATYNRDTTRHVRVWLAEHAGCAERIAANLDGARLVYLSGPYSQVDYVPAVVR